MVCSHTYAENKHLNEALLKVAQTYAYILQYHT